MTDGEWVKFVGSGTFAAISAIVGHLYWMIATLGRKIDRVSKERQDGDRKLWEARDGDNKRLADKMDRVNERMVTKEDLREMEKRLVESFRHSA
jgi:hypothetical protein